MKKIHINLPNLEISCSDKVNFPLMICSHERSGTHFLMNSIGQCTDYTVNPFLNYDYIPLGSYLNFFSEVDTKNFFDLISNIKIAEKSNNIINSLIKSHFPISLFSKMTRNRLKIIYIYRHPAAVFISFWRLIHRWEWFEGPKAKTPLELAKSIPSGQSQRYQIQNYPNYFSRWANHVIDAKRASLTSQDIYCLNYHSLLTEHSKTIQNVCEHFQIPINSKIETPLRDNYIKGQDMKLSDIDRDNLYDFCIKESKNFPELPNDILNQG